jgi:hypothetical protein
LLVAGKLFATKGSEKRFAGCGAKSLAGCILDCQSEVIFLCSGVQHGNKLCLRKKLLMMLSNFVFIKETSDLVFLVFALVEQNYSYKNLWLATKKVWGMWWDALYTSTRNLLLVMY